MPNNSVVAPLVRGKISRFTLVDACGMPQITNSMYVTDGFVSVQSTKNMDAGDEIKLRQANGIIGVYERGRQSLLDFTVDVQFTKIDPGALAMLTGDSAVLDYASKIVGWEERALIQITQNFGLEVWTDTSGGGCVSGSKLYGYMLYPMLEQAYITFDNVTDKEVTGTIHAQSKGSPSWGRGPYGATGDGSSVTGPVATAAGPPPTPGRLLVAVATNAHRHFEITPVAPPAAQTFTGPQSITLPTAY
jgi:hypothetical protein